MYDSIGPPSSGVRSPVPRSASDSQHGKAPREPGPRRIYLDQCRFVQLAHAAYGRTDGKRFHDVYHRLLAAVDQGRVSCPLSAIHYMETQTQRLAEKRKRLADVMFRLSRLHTIADVQRIVSMEIDRALATRPDSTGTVRATNIFGTGVGHAFGRVFDLDPPTSDTLGLELHNDLAAKIRVGFEYAALAGQADDVRLPMYDLHESLDNRFAADEQLLATQLHAKGLRGAALDEAVGLIELSELRVPINDALARAGLGTASFWRQPPRALVGFLELLPTRLVVWKLRAIRYRNLAERWKPNDLHDITAMSVAVVHCDVVMPDAQWAHHLRTAGLDTRFGCVILTDLNALMDYL